MVSTTNFEHAKLYVSDLESASRFLAESMGLVLIEERDDTRYYGCGLDRNFDIAIEAGTEPGLDHFAIRATADEVEALGSTLEDRDVDVEAIDGEPSVESGVRFELPLGAEMEVVEVADRRYVHSDAPRLERAAAQAPVDVDHVTFRTAAIEETVDFLTDIGFTTTEVLTPDGGEDGPWKGAFLRSGVWHHDIGFVMLDPDQVGFSLGHIAWTMRNVEHMRSLIDHLVGRGDQLELSPFRHYAGDNLAAYFEEPGGNLFEICAEMATIPDDAPIEYTAFRDGYSVWGGVPTRD